MKKVTYVFTILFMISTYTFAQGITVSIPTKGASNGETVLVPLNVTNFNDIGAISIKIDYDPAVLTYVGVENKPAGGNWTHNALNGVITIGWFGTTPINLGDSKLLDIKFTYISGTSNLTFKAGNEIANSAGSVQTVTYTNGAVQPGFSGVFYIGVTGSKPDGGDPEYATLKAAVSALNQATLTGNVTFLITSNLDETDHSGIGLDTKGYTVTFKPAPSISPVITFTKTTDNVGVSGGLVIGAPDLTITSATNYGLVPTRNIVIDGSNTVDGTTRDLTIRTSTTSHGNTNPIRIIGDVNNITIKNIILVAQNSVSYCLSVTNRTFNSATFTPDSITVENCDISSSTTSNSGQAIGFSVSPSSTVYMQDCIIRNNRIRARTRGIFLNTAGNINIYGNHITVAQPNTGSFSSGIMVMAQDPASTLNIYGNYFSELSTGNKDAGSYGMNGIWATAPATYNIYNNMITGFNTTTAVANPTCQLNGIRIDVAATVNAYFNTISLPDVNFTAGTGKLNYRGIYISNGTVDLKNNIIVTNETTDSSFCIYKESAAATVTSNYNDLYAAGTGAIGSWHKANQLLINDWQTASGQDANSISVNPGFVSETDLHLAGNLSPVMGKGLSIPSITTDFDGETRDNIPEIGADDIPGVVPVELASFTAGINANGVTLTWKTITETNNARFDVERRINNEKWETIGSVAGNGTTAEVNEYTFTDKISGYSELSYRLKQVDLDGTFQYSKIVEVMGQGTAKEFSLNQNYPNPFNPTTKITYSIPADNRVNLSVYSITGELVSELVNTNQAAGTYTVEFNASELANGIYIYKIQAGNFVQTRKMMLIK